MSSGTKSTRLVEVAPGIFAHASGALWLAETRTALMADVHLGYGWAQRRRGQLGPVDDGGVRERLVALVAELVPVRVVFLGDLVHAPRPGREERELVESSLLPLAEQAELVLVTGNHDRGFADDFSLPLQIRAEWTQGDLLAVHGDQPVEARSKLLVVGHHHPAFGVRDAAGVKQKVPVFLVGENTIVLPAFSPFAAGVDVSRGLSPALQKLLGRQTIRSITATGKRALLLGPLVRR